MDIVHIALLIAAGIAAGFVNTIAGGGSILTLPALMLLGMPADIANASNRVGVLLQSLAAMREFGQHGKLDTHALLPILGPTLLGSLAGSLVASYLPVEWLKPMLLGTMTVMTLVILVKPDMLPQGETTPLTLRERPSAAAWLFLCGLYGGFVQAGVGFLLIATVAGALRYDLVRANALKMTCTGIFGLVALIVFALRGQVDWIPGIICGVATIIGVKLSVRYALNADHAALKRWLVGMSLVVVIAAVFK